jgi:hypothetical protein
MTTSSADTSKATHATDRIAWWREHLGLVLSSLGVACLAVKVWAVAHGETATVTELLSEARPSDLAQALLSGLPVAALAVLFVALSSLGEAISEGDDLREPMTAGAFSLAVAVALAPAPLFWGVLLLGGARIPVALLVRALRRALQARAKRVSIFLRASQHPRSNSMGLDLAIVAFIGMAVLATSDRPWLTAEELTLTGKAEPVIGYVISQDESWTRYMSDGERQVVIIDTARVTGRSPCRAGGAWTTRSLLSKLLWKESRTPSCST